MNLLKSTFGKVGEPSTSIDNNNRYDPKEDGDVATSFNSRGSEEIVNETAETSDDEEFEDLAVQKKVHSSGSVFDTPDRIDMDSDDVETNEAVKTSGMNVIDENLGKASAIEENNNMKAPSKQTG